MDSRMVFGDTEFAVFGGIWSTEYIIEYLMAWVAQYDDEESCSTLRLESYS